MQGRIDFLAVLRYHKTVEGFRASVKALTFSFLNVCSRLRLSAVAEVEDREKARAAVRADDDAEAADGDLAHVRERGAHFVSHVLGVGKAVGVEDVHRKAIGARLTTILR